MPRFTLADVSVRVGDRSPLSSVSLDLHGHGVTGLIGHNGSGKSTLLKLLARQAALSSGTVALDGRPLAAWSDRAFAREVAYMPQRTPDTAGMLVRELVALGRYPWHGALGRFGAKDRSHAAEAIDLTGIAHLAHRQVETLSGGERQRAWLAMLVAQDAKLLLLDEPISALDIRHQIEVLALVRSLSHARGLGVVVVLHDINLAATYCDRIVALHGGRLIADGTPGELMRPACLEAIYGLRMDVMAHPTTGGPMSYVV